MGLSYPGQYNAEVFLPDTSIVAPVSHEWSRLLYMGKSLQFSAFFFRLTFIERRKKIVVRTFVSCLDLSACVSERSHAQICFLILRL